MSTCGSSTCEKGVESQFPDIRLPRGQTDDLPHFFQTFFVAIACFVG